MTKSKKILAIVLAVIFTAVTVFLGFLFFKIIPDINKQKEHQAQVKQYYLDKVALFEEENKSLSPGEIDVVFLGDSLTDLYDLKTYYPQYKTLNRGIGADTTFGLEDRLKVSVYDVKPKVAVMLIGVNNINTMFDNYEDILKGFKTNIPNTKIVLLSLTALGGNLWGERNQLSCYNNVKIKKLAEEYGYSFVDLYTPLFDARTGEVREGLTVDGGHFTHEGYLILTEQITPVLESLLN